MEGALGISAKDDSRICFGDEEIPGGAVERQADGLVQVGGHDLERGVGLDALVQGSYRGGREQEPEEGSEAEEQEWPARGVWTMRQRHGWLRGDRATRTQEPDRNATLPFLSEGRHSVNGKVFAVPDKMFAVSATEVNFGYISPSQCSVGSLPARYQIAMVP
jgi:hypothetical protein